MDLSVEAAKAEIAHCFVPQILLEFIKNKVRQNKNKIEPASFFINGVCLLVDISGFTMMSEKFCTGGKGGIDELQLATNGYMGKLVDVIYSYGGDIIKFAGDALICIFSNEDIQSINKSTIIETSTSSKITKNKVDVSVILKALQCAHTIRSVHNETLSVHVAMSCGEMCFGILGGVENRWECLISGPCIHQLSGCLDDAPSMAAAMTTECLEILQNHAVLSADLTEDDVEELQEYTETEQEPDLQQHTTTNTTTTADTWILHLNNHQYEITLLSLPSHNQRIINVTPDHAELIQEACSDRNNKNIKNRAVLLSSRQKTQIESMVHKFVPAPIAEELDSTSSLHFLAEIREVTTMFMKVIIFMLYVQ